MTLLVAGTVPLDPGRLIEGAVTARDDSLFVGEMELPGCQGTAAMLLAANSVVEYLGADPIHAVLGGDIGRGDGTRAVYGALSSAVDRIRPSVVEFHYLQPTMALMKRAIEQFDALGVTGEADSGDEKRLRLVADAGGMYAARASGVGSRFELMTPDIGEVGFLADATVSHPAYVSHYLFGVEGFDPVALAGMAQQGSAARVLLVKGSTDHVIEDGEVRATICEPMVPELEAIGGTGDTLAGLASGLMACGYETVEASEVAARVNRVAGQLLKARPDHGPVDLARHFRAALCETGVH